MTTKKKTKTVASYPTADQTREITRKGQISSLEKLMKEVIKKIITKAEAGYSDLEAYWYNGKHISNVFSKEVIKEAQKALVSLGFKAKLDSICTIYINWKTIEQKTWKFSAFGIDFSIKTEA